MTRRTKKRRRRPVNSPRRMLALRSYSDTSVKLEINGPFVTTTSMRSRRPPPAEIARRTHISGATGLPTCPPKPPTPNQNSKGCPGPSASHTVISTRVEGSGHVVGVAGVFRAITARTRMAVEPGMFASHWCWPLASTTGRGPMSLGMLIHVP